MEQQDPRVRPMSRAENAAYRGVTVDEDGAEAQDEERGAYENMGRSGVRYVRIGSVPRSSLLSSVIWAVVLAALLSFIIFVALPAIAMVVVGVLVLGALVSLIGRGRVWSAVMRRLSRYLYGR